MAILVNEETKTFHLQTDNTSYVFRIHHNRYPLHMHYGKKIRDIGDNTESVIDCTGRASFMPAEIGVLSADGPKEGPAPISIESYPLEYSFYGNPDLRTPSFHAQYADGSTVTEAMYAGYRTYTGKKPLKGLPAVYAEQESEAETLEVDFQDSLTGLVITLQYSVFPAFDAITRSVHVHNGGKDVIDIKSILSVCVDFYGKDYMLTHLDGGYAWERYVRSQPVTQGYQGIDSKRGASSHAHNPFLALSEKSADETHGDVYGFSFIYSGNFIAEAYVSQFNMTRIHMGLNPFDFNWRLESGESFQAPEAVMIYSDAGFGKMSRLFHRLFRKRLCRGKFRDTMRPVLINSWEAAYFDFDEEKILNFAKSAKDAGVDLMVLDDGWFGKRNSDNCSLGDWYPNLEKLPSGIDGLAKKINDMGLEFGLWFEPEMVSPDSDLYRAHPDWCLHVAGRDRTMGRHQLILDLSRDDVCDYIIDAVSAVLSSASISYVKWDMNRNMTEIGSALLPAERQREIPHRYMLGLYRVMETLVSRFPDILFESCAGGGGRFDAGMLYYMPQTWTSDDTDALERLYIQYGTSMVYPASAIGAHVSTVPNHQMNRITPLATRGAVAMTGQFGYELDLRTLSPEEFEEVKEQIRFYKSIRETIQHGDLYRLASPFTENHMMLEYVSEDKNTAIFCHYTILAQVHSTIEKIRLQGLNPDATYVLEQTGEEFGGDWLMNIGLKTKDLKDFESKMYVFRKK